MGDETSFPVFTPSAPDRTLFVPGGPLINFPYVTVPNWVTLSPEVDVRALGAYGFLRSFVNESLGQWTANLTVHQFADRFGVGPQAITKAPDPGKTTLSGKGGIVQRLQAAGALTSHRRWTKTRDCSGCAAPKDQDCAPGCEETSGRVRAAPLYRIASAPPSRGAHPGPLNLAEYKHPGLVAERLEQVAQLKGPGPEVYPFGFALTWVVLHPELDAIDVGVYLFICAHTSMAEGRMDCKLLRSRVMERFGIGELRVSRATAALERVGALEKTNLEESPVTGRRYGRKRATALLVRVAPPKGEKHPYALDITEWRDPSRIKARTAPARRRPGLRPGKGKQAPANDVVPGQQGSGEGYPQGGETGYPQAPEPHGPEAPGVTSQSAPEGSPEGGPGNPVSQDVTPDLGFVDNSGGSSGEDGTPVENPGGLRPHRQGVTSSQTSITSYYLTNYLGGALPSVGGHPQGAGERAGDELRERWALAHDVVRVALDRLPGSVAPMRRETDLMVLVDAVADRLAEGFTPVQLAEAFSVATESVRSAWVLTVRAADPARWLPEGSRRPAGTVDRGGKPEWCGECAGPERRLRSNADESVMWRCPECNPNARPL